jgi:dTDP-4-amino-4,6-dideoxygalactose transaminase
MGRLETTSIKTPLFKVFMADSVMDSLQRTLFSGYIAEGENVKRLTRLVSEFIENPRTVLVNSCTSALTLAFRLAGVGPGTEVITTPLTSVAGNTPILELGAVPVWVDSDPDTGMVDPNDIEHLITEGTRAICVLHKEGDPARLSEILPIARKHGLKVVEDAAHAFGSRYRGAGIGTHGDYVCFSFQAIKHMTTGDGGALACKSEEDYLKARKLKWFGVDHDNPQGGDLWLQDVPEWGYKANLNDVAAAIGLENMQHVKMLNEQFHRNGLLYGELLNEIPGLKLVKRDLENDYSIYWAYCVIVENRESLIRKLAEDGVAAAQIHPRNDLYSMFSMSKRPLPNIDYFAARELSLPCGWWVSEQEVERICGVIKQGW